MHFTLLSPSINTQLWLLQKRVVHGDFGDWHRLLENIARVEGFVLVVKLELIVADDHLANDQPLPIVDQLAEEIVKLVNGDLAVI